MNTYIEESYMWMLNNGATPQEARDILTNALKTEVVTTANLRQWRHVFMLRRSRRAHPQMREVIIPLWEEMRSRIPVVFDDC